MTQQYFLSDEAKTEQLAAALAARVTAPCIIYLEGELGAGKTTFVRGFLRAQGYHALVKSPTYTLVEPYQFNHLSIFHFDLYRLHKPDELEYLGIRDYFNEEAIVLIEWPEKGLGLLAAPDITINLQAMNQGRQLKITAHSDKGKEILQQPLD